MMHRRRFLKISALLGASAGLAPLRLHGAQDVWPDDPFLAGNYAPVFDELDVPDLQVIGELPSGLEGMYVRNGPNPQMPPIGGAYHWFDGDGMVHGVELRGGRARYRNRWVQTSGLALEREQGRALWPSINGRQRDRRAPRSAGRFKNVANTALLWHGGRLLALWEGGAPYAMTVPELETEGVYTFDGALTHAMTAHPKADPRTGELCVIGYDLVKAPYLQYSVFGGDGSLKHHTAVDLPKPVMMHDFTITERYSVFLDLPVRLNLRRALTGRPPLEFVPDMGARIGVLDRRGDGASVRWFEVEPCYVFHTLGAWEQADEVVIQGCRFEQFPEFNDAIADRAEPLGRDPSHPYLYQWRLNLKTGAVKEGWLTDRSSEFPRVDDRQLGKEPQAGFAVAAGGSAWIRYDVRLGTEARHELGAAAVGGEGVFVPRPDGSTGGWYMGYVHDLEAGVSELRVVDADAFDQEPVARVVLPRRVPHGFHGTWVPDVGSAVAGKG